RTSVPNQQARTSVPNQQARASVPNQQARASVPNQQARASVPNQQARASVPNRSGSQNTAYGNQSRYSQGGNHGQSDRNTGYGQYGRSADYEQRFDKGWETMQQKQRELKERLQQRYGQQQKSNSYNTTKNVYGNSGTKARQNDIFSRATANVMENAADKLERQMEMNAERSGTVPDSHSQANTYTSTDTYTVGDTSVFVNTYSLAAAMDADKSSDLMRQVSDLMITGYQAEISFERDFLAEGMALLSRYEVGK
ncbi:MAG: hypothetical protein J6C37_13170, partial [Roseburia sp.]|nr:hypothetical protein [Roseburia sp.]